VTGSKPVQQLQQFFFQWNYETRLKLAYFGGKATELATLKPTYRTNSMSSSLTFYAEKQTARRARWIRVETGRDRTQLC